MKEQKLIYLTLDEIKPYENNPRFNDDAVEKVAESIKQFGFRSPIIVDNDHVIICGHTRYKASIRLGLESVPVIVASDLTPEQVKAYRLADNKTAEFAEWDDDLLSKELSEILEINMTDFGFEELNLEEEVEAKEDDYDFDKEVELKVHRGDVWKLGNHRLMCGDSTDEKDVLKLCNGQKVDLLVTDPPYNVNYEGGTGMKIQNDKQEDKKFHEFLLKAFKLAKQVMKPGASFYVWYASRETINFFSAIKESGLTSREQLIWKKNALVLGRSDYQWIHEQCIYGWSEGSSHSWYNDRSQTTVMEFDKPRENKLHPTMKPEPLFDYLIKNSSKAGDLVLDLFGGSGTTIVCCEQNKRNAYVMELDEKYASVIVDRWETLTGLKAEKL